MENPSVISKIKKLAQETLIALVVYLFLLLKGGSKGHLHIIQLVRGKWLWRVPLVGTTKGVWQEGRVFRF